MEALPPISRRRLLQATGAVAAGFLAGPAVAGAEPFALGQVRAGAYLVQAPDDGTSDNLWRILT